MEKYSSFISDLSKLLDEARASRDESHDKYKALAKITKSANALLRDLESLQSLERSKGK